MKQKKSSIVSGQRNEGLVNENWTQGPIVVFSTYIYYSPTRKDKKNNLTAKTFLPFFSHSEP